MPIIFMKDATEIYSDAGIGSVIGAVFAGITLTIAYGVTLSIRLPVPAWLASLSVWFLLFALLVGVLRGLSGLCRISPGTRTVLLFAASVIATTLVFALTKTGPLLGFLFSFGASLAGFLSGGALGLARDYSRASANRFGDILAVVIAIFALVMPITTISWLVEPGTDSHVFSFHLFPSRQRVSSLPESVADPSRQGPYETTLLFYAAADDPHRPEYGPVSDIVTDHIDLTAFLPSLADAHVEQRSEYWGVRLDKAPINGRLWIPDAEGTFPLVLIAHGNHPMHRTPDAGFDYLGELLASRGFIVASMDHSFLNMSWRRDDFQGEEIGARAILFLEHISAFRRWHSDPLSPVYGRVDLDKIAVVGHSRGGEAAAVSAAFNQMSVYPGNAHIALDYGFSIRSVVAMSPSDAFYKPGGRKVALGDTSYLTIHGGHDGDVATFLGLCQMDRVSLRTERDELLLKAAVWAYTANHSHFNTELGTRDVSAPLGWLLNTQPIMRPDAQQRIASVFISAFLEATLRGKDNYVSVFMDPALRSALFPKDGIITQYRDSRHIALAGKGSAIDPTTGDIDGGRITARGFTEWKVDALPLRARVLADSRENTGTFLRWDGPNARWTLDLPTDIGHNLDLSDEWTMNLSVADLRPPRNVDGELLDFTIEFIDKEGQNFRAPLSEFGGVSPVLPLRTFKPGLPEGLLLDQWEVIPQSIEVPLAPPLSTGAERFDASKLSQINLCFDLTYPGYIVIDEVSLRPPR